MTNKKCTGLFDHSLSSRTMVTTETTTEVIHKVCTKCGYVEDFPHSVRQILFVNNTLMQQKKWGADDNRKELLQPLNRKGEVNQDFTDAYGYNPFDEKTKKQTPKFQGGEAA